MTASTSDLELTVRRTVRAGPERVFEAWTDPAALKKWWGPAGVQCPEASVDLRVGGRYRIANRMEDGNTVWIHGEFLEVDRPSRLVYSWGIEPNDALETVTVRFEPVGGQTEVSVLHQKIANDQARREHEQGWIGCLDGLAELLGGQRG